MTHHCKELLFEHLCLFR
uniref:Uncharacterized protein n=1 Tax=Anguilla anguilla TaxID=7936 RepID=A0A0E9UT58_ANGAN